VPTKVSGPSGWSWRPHGHCRTRRHGKVSVGQGSQDSRQPHSLGPASTDPKSRSCGALPWGVRTTRGPYALWQETCRPHSGSDLQANTVSFRDYRNPTSVGNVSETQYKAAGSSSPRDEYCLPHYVKQEVSCLTPGDRLDKSQQSL
jgi:hypothetical protein